MKKQSGFTLIELAIVLVIIGLLLGGVLKGQELINSSRIKNVVNDFNSTSAAMYGYQDRYRALPGDDLATTANTRWAGTPYPAATGGNADGVLNNGAGGCVFTDNAASGANECAVFWIQLRQAGFITGTLTAGPPRNAYNGTLGVQNAADALQTGGNAGTGFRGVIVCESNIPDKSAQAIDTQLDDGDPDTGSVRSLLQADQATAQTALDTTAGSTDYVETGTSWYTVCKAQQ